MKNVISESKMWPLTTGVYLVLRTAAGRHCTQKVIQIKYRLGCPPALLFGSETCYGLFVTKVIYDSRVS